MSPTNLPTAPRQKIADIQILRSYAILTVIFGHFSVCSSLMALLPGNLTSPFWIGVELFFVISGFIVTKTVVEGRSMDAGQFFMRRAFRLLPAMLAFIVLSGLTVAMAARFASSDTWAAQKLIVSFSEFSAQSLAVLGGYFINRGGSLYTNTAMWSLSVEFQFYFAFALVLAVAGLLRLSRANTATTLLVLAVVVYALAIVYRVSGWMPSWLVASMYYVKGWKFDFMALGVITYFVSRSQTLSFRFGPALAAVALTLPIAIALASEHALLAGPNSQLEKIGLPIMGVCFALAVLVASKDQAFVGKDTRLYKALLWVGNRSYSLYLVHLPVMALIWVALFKFYPSALFNVTQYNTIQAIGTVLLAGYLAHLSFTLIEQKDKAMQASFVNALFGSPQASTSNASAEGDKS